MSKLYTKPLFNFRDWTIDANLRQNGGKKEIKRGLV